MTNRIQNRRAITAAAAVALMSVVAHTQADTENWTPTSGGSWNTATNWTDVQTQAQHVPVIGDIALFPTALTSPTISLDFNAGNLAAGAIVDNITPTSAAASYLTFAGTNTSGGNLVLSGATVTVPFTTAPTESLSNVILSSTATSTTQNKNLTFGSTINMTLTGQTNQILTYAGQGSSSKVNSSGNMPIITVSGNITDGPGVHAGITFLGGGNIGGAGANASAPAVVGGELNLGGINTFTGGLTIGNAAGSQGGTVDLLTPTALPTTGTITVNEDGQLAFVAGSNGTAPTVYGAPGQTLVLNGIGANKTISGSIRPTGGTAAYPIEWAGNIQLGSSAAADGDLGYVLTTVASGGSDFKVLGNITGPSTGGLIEQGGGILEIGGAANNYGTTQLGNGGIVVDAGANLSPGDAWLFQTSTNNPTLTLDNAAQSIGNLRSSFTATGATVPVNASGFSQNITLNGTVLTVNETTNQVFGYGNVVGLTSGITDGTQFATPTGGAGSLVYNGSTGVALVLSGPNSYTGGTTINHGTLSIANLVPGTSPSTNNNSALGSGPVTVNSGATLATGGFTAATGFNGNTAPVVVTSGLITGSLQVNGGGIVSPGNGAAGSLYVGSLNASTGSIFDFAVGSAVAGNYSTLVSAGAITLAPGGAETINITGSKLAVGSFTLVTGTSITGNTFVEGSTPAGPNRTYTLSSNGTSEILTIVNTGTERDFSTTGTSPLIDGSGTFGQGATNFVQNTNGVSTNSATYNNTDNFDTAFGNGGTGGQITILAGGARVGGTLILGPLQTGSMYTFGTPGSTNAITTVAGVFASNSALINAPVVLGGSQTYSVDTGNTVVLTGAVSESVTASQLTKTGSGTLALNGGTGTWTGGTVVTGGILQTTTAALPATGGIANSASLVFDQVTPATTGSYAGLISGTGTVTVQNTGTVTLANTANTYTGQTIITGGTLAVGNVSSLGTGDGGILLSGGTLQANASLSFPLTNGAAGATSRKLTLAAGTTSTVNAGGYAVTFGQDITGQGNITFNGGGSVTLTGVPSTTVIGSVAVGANTSFIIAPPSLVPSFGFSFSSSPGTVAGNIVVATPIELRLYGGDFNGGGNLVIEPAGMLTVARANTTIDGGSGIVLNPSNTAGVSESIGSANGFIFTINGVISGNSAVDFTSGNATSDLILGAVNTYTGATTIDQPVTLGINNGIPVASDVTMTGSGVFDLAGFNQSINSLASSKVGSEVTNSNAGTANSVLTITGAASTMFQGSIQDATYGATIGLTLNGTGALALTNVSSYSGPVNILDGRLDIIISDPSAGTGLGAASIINIGGGSNASNAQLRFSGVGSATAPAVVSYVTPTHPFATPPVINLNSLGGYNTGTTLDTGAIRISGASYITLPDNINFNAASAITVTGASQLILSGNLAGTGTFISNGDGLTVLTGTNPAYTGGTEIDAGTLNVASGSVLGSGTLAVNNNLNSLAGTTGTAVTLNLLNTAQTVGSLSGSITPPTNGTNTATITVPTGTTLTVNQTTDGIYAGNITGGGALIKTGPNALTIGGAEPFTGSINVSTGTLTIAANPGPGLFNQIAGGVTIGSGAKLELAVNPAHSTRTLLTTSLTLTSGSSTLDLGDNDLDVPAGSLATLTAAVARGYNLAGGANWAGPGLTSSAAAANPQHLTALGVIQNNQDGTAVFSSSNNFDGTAPGPSDILVKYTYFGDANLDGTVDGSDYSLIDAGYASKGTLTGWYNGDFNYDGVIDGSDYALIDNAFNSQAANLSPSAEVASETDQIAATPAAVPEPVSSALLLTGATLLAARNRRKY